MDSPKIFGNQGFTRNGGKRVERFDNVILTRDTRSNFPGPFVEKNRSEIIENVGKKAAEGLTKFSDNYIIESKLIRFLTKKLKGVIDMIQVIYGKRGSGKSKKMVSLANEQVKTSKGNVVFVDDDSRAIHELDRQIRFIDASEYSLTDYRSIYGFLCGIISTNYDVTTIFIDGLLNGMDKKSESSDKVFARLQEFSEKNSIDLYIAMHDEGDLAISELEKYKVFS